MAIDSDLSFRAQANKHATLIKPSAHLHKCIDVAMVTRVSQRCDAMWRMEIQRRHVFPMEFNTIKFTSVDKTAVSRLSFLQ